jgi:hypothetical protein
MSQKVSLSQRAWNSFQFFLCLGIVGLLLAYLTLGHSRQTHEEPVAVEQEADVRVFGAKSIFIRPDSPIFRKLQIATINRTETTDPVVTVTGVDVASLQTNGNHLAGTPRKPISVDEMNDFWQFHSTELLTAFADWQKADAEIAYAEKQLQSTEKLAKATLEA